MKSFLIAKLTLLLTSLLLGGCLTVKEPTINVKSDKKILIVYLSRTKNTEAVAKMINRALGGKLVELELKSPYPENYQAIVQQVQQENESGFLPPLKTKIDSLDIFDIVFIGFPTWGMRLPPPIKTLLIENNFNRKIVVPFNTNAGYGIGSSISTLQQLCAGCQVLPEFSVKGGIERDGILYVMQGAKEIQVQNEVQNWLKGLNLNP